MAQIRRLALVWGGALLLAGCDCTASLTEDLYAGFQQLCGDAPCGWTSEGSAAVRLAPTIHSSETGVVLGEGAVISLDGLPLRIEPLGIVRRLAGLIGCDEDAGVSFTLAFNQDGKPRELTLSLIHI